MVGWTPAPLSGLAVGALGCGALVQFAPAPTHLAYALLLAGMVLAAAAVAAAGTVVADVGFGASALGCFGTLARLAAPQERGELFAVAFVIAYLAFSLPAILAGFADNVMGVLLAVLAVAMGALSVWVPR